MIELKSERQLDSMRQACRIVRLVLEELKKRVKPGISTIELDKISAELIGSYGGVPAFKGYRGFPANICTSVNEAIVHGIPSKRVLKDGDIISLDVGVKFDGYFGDAAFTLAVGDISQTAKKLIDITSEALYIGIAQAYNYNRLSNISYGIQNFVENNGFSVVREFVGHGIGTSMHEDPKIPNFGRPDEGPSLKAGMVLAIEPMINEGLPDVEILDDGWTAVTLDRKLSAHFEHTVLITETKAEVLT
jgi:methionyl aminopeptidase